MAGILAALVLTATSDAICDANASSTTSLREELRRAEHFAALGKLLAGVAHEVRNPLAAIRSTVQLYQRLPEQARKPAALEPSCRASIVSTTWSAGCSFSCVPATRTPTRRSQRHRARR